VTWALTGVSGDVNVGGVIEVTEVGIDRTVGGILRETGIVTGESTSVSGKITVSGEIGVVTLLGWSGCRGNR
jgi:hypothetical protein